jgi:hypothetical protein
MKSDPDGLFSLAYDGVLRSYDGNHKVIDYLQLNPEQIAAFLDKLQQGHDLRKWEGVDGIEVTDEKALWDPPQNLKPMTREEMERVARPGERVDKDLAQE